jgi:hypothetical protein
MLRTRVYDAFVTVLLIPCHSAQKHFEPPYGTDVALERQSSLVYHGWVEGLAAGHQPRDRI